MSNLTKNDLTRKEFELNLAGLVGGTVDEVDMCWVTQRRKFYIFKLSKIKNDCLCLSHLEFQVSRFQYEL